MRAIVLLAGLVWAAAAQPTAPGHPIDLDQPGVLEALARDNPEHFAKVQRILAQAPRLPLPAVQGWIRAEFKADDVAAPFLLKTSFPPQARLSFSLEGTRYTKVIYISVDDKR